MYYFHLLCPVVLSSLLVLEIEPTASHILGRSSAMEHLQLLATITLQCYPGITELPSHSKSLNKYCMVGMVLGTENTEVKLSLDLKLPFSLDGHLLGLCWGIRY